MLDLGLKAIFVLNYKSGSREGPRMLDAIWATPAIAPRGLSQTFGRFGLSPIAGFSQPDSRSSTDLSIAVVMVLRCGNLTFPGVKVKVDVGSWFDGTLVLIHRSDSCDGSRRPDAFWVMATIAPRGLSQPLGPPPNGSPGSPRNIIALEDCCALRPSKPCF